MAWFNADDKMYGHPKSRRAGLEAMGLWLLAGTLSAATDTPGYISRADLRSITARRKPVAQLVEAELWDVTKGGYVFRGGSECWRIVERTRDPIPISIRMTIYKRDGWKCLHCGTTKNLTLDHIWPWSKGGPDTEDNLQTLCGPCNSSKDTRVP